jgi:hypothetical protein
MDPLLAMYIAAACLLLALLVFLLEPFRKSKLRVLIAAPLLAMTIYFGFIFFTKGGFSLLT